MNELNGKPIKPDSNLVWAVLTTCCCCLPLGIVAIVYATKVDGLYAVGDYIGAQDAANKAKKYSIMGAVISGVVLLLYIIFIVVVTALATSHKL